MKSNYSNGTIIKVTVATILIIIMLPTSINVLKTHNNRARLVVEKRILEAAEKCVNEEKCSTINTTLNDLYKNNYLDTQYDPVTKKVYDKNIKITFSNGKYGIKLN